MTKKIGRPATYKTPQALQKKIDQFFEYCRETERFPTVLGLVVFLGFSDRRSLLDYEQRSDEFSHIIKRAKTRIYDDKAQAAMRGEINPTVFIFDAVNNHGFINTRSEGKQQAEVAAEVSSKQEPPKTKLPPRVVELLDKITSRQIPEKEDQSQDQIDTTDQVPLLGPSEQD